MREEKHYGDRVPVWDGDTHQWKRYLRDIELYLETEKKDVDFPHGARLQSRLPAARKYAFRLVGLHFPSCLRPSLPPFLVGGSPLPLLLAVFCGRSLPMKSLHLT